MCVTLTAPEPALELRTDCPPEELSTWELVVSLDRAGFGHVVKEKSSRDPDFDPEVSASKVWYTKPQAVQVCREYLLCLLRASFKVKHWQVAGFYAALLAGKEYVPKRKAIKLGEYDENDSDAGALPPRTRKRVLTGRKRAPASKVPEPADASNESDMGRERSQEPSSSSRPPAQPEPPLAGPVAMTEAAQASLRDEAASDPTSSSSSNSSSDSDSDSSSSESSSSSSDSSSSAPQNAAPAPTEPAGSRTVADCQPEQWFCFWLQPCDASVQRLRAHRLGDVVPSPSAQRRGGQM